MNSYQMYTWMGLYFITNKELYLIQRIQSICCVLKDDVQNKGITFDPHIFKGTMIPLGWTFEMRAT